MSFSFCLFLVYSDLSTFLASTELCSVFNPCNGKYTLTDNEINTITCNGPRTCNNLTITATNGSLLMNCDGIGDIGSNINYCNGTIVINSHVPTTLNCAGFKRCHETIFRINYHSNQGSILCNGDFSSCRSSNFTISNGVVNIHCNGTGNSCRASNFYITNSQVSFICDNNNACRAQNIYCQNNSLCTVTTLSGDNIAANSKISCDGSSICACDGEHSCFTQDPTEISFSPTIVTINPTLIPSLNPTETPSVFPTNEPTITPTVDPSNIPTFIPTLTPSNNPTITRNPSQLPTINPSSFPTQYPTISPSLTSSDSNSSNGTTLLIIISVSLILFAVVTTIICIILFKTRKSVTIIKRLSREIAPPKPKVQKPKQSHMELEVLPSNSSKQTVGFENELKPYTTHPLIYSDDINNSEEGAQNDNIDNNNNNENDRGENDVLMDLNSKITDGGRNSEFGVSLQNNKLTEDLMIDDIVEEMNEQIDGGELLPGVQTKE